MRQQAHAASTRHQTNELPCAGAAVTTTASTSASNERFMPPHSLPAPGEA